MYVYLVMYMNAHRNSEDLIAAYANINDAEARIDSLNAPMPHCYEIRKLKVHE